MKCLICAKFCLGVICEKCLDSIPLRPSVREVSGVNVYCFFAYSDIDFLLSAKYYAIGSRIYAALGKIAGKYFFSQKAMREAIRQIIENTAFGEVKLIGIDDCVRSFYSHTGVLVREFALSSANSHKKSKDLQNRAKSSHKPNAIVPIYGELKATNQVSYAGKSLAFRQANKRGLTLSAKISSTKNSAGFSGSFKRICSQDFLWDFCKRFRARFVKYFAKDFVIRFFGDFINDFVKFANRVSADFRDRFGTKPKDNTTQKNDSSVAMQNQALDKDSTLDLKADSALDSSVDSKRKSTLDSVLDFDTGCVIIVDDIITTGTSFGEAIEVCQKRGLKVLFCLSLCNAAL